MPVWWHTKSPAAFLNDRAEVAHSYLSTPWEGGAAPPAALGATCLQMSLAPAPRARPPSIAVPPSCGASAPELPWLLVAEGQGLLGFGSASRNARLGGLGQMDGHCSVHGEEVCDGLLSAGG